MVSGVVKKAGNRELVFNRYRVSAGEDEDVREMDGSESCTTKWLHLMPEHRTLKHGQNGTFSIMYILLQASKQDHVLTKKKRTGRFLPREVHPRKWYPACGRWCFHQPLQARKLLLLCRSPWPLLSGIQAHGKLMQYSSNSELHSLWIYSSTNSTRACY